MLAVCVQVSADLYSQQWPQMMLFCKSVVLVTFEIDILF